MKEIWAVGRYLYEMPRDAVLTLVCRERTVSYDMVRVTKLIHARNHASCNFVSGSISHDESSDHRTCPKERVMSPALSMTHGLEEPTCAETWEGTSLA